jgi:hypothetical protein
LKKHVLQPFHLEITRNFARAFLMKVALTVLLLDFLDSGSDINHDIGGPLSNFG